MPTISTRRFLLRDYTPDDRDAFVAYQTDPAFTLFHHADELGEENAHKVFSLFLEWQTHQPRLNHQLALTLGQDPAILLGSCGVRMEGCAAGEAVFGIELARAYWGRYAYANEASAAMIDWAFRYLPLHALVADTAMENRAVARLAQAAGFVRAHADAKQWWRLARTDWERLHPL